MTGNREILARLDAGIVNLSNTGGLSSYPHSELMPAPPPGQWRPFSIWTEEVVPGSQYQVRWSNYDLLGFDGPPMMPFLNVAVGESVQSQYCLERQGYDRSLRYPCDYSESRLTYRLPYMNPRKYYMLEAIGYQNKENSTRQRVSLGGRSWDVTLRRDRPETLQVVLPRGIYDSTAVMLRLERVAGQRVVLAGLKLFEFEVIEKDGGGGQAGPQQRRVTEPALTAHPNPFSRSLSVRYALPRAGVVEVKVFDISGREVRCLVNGAMPAGTRTLVFDGRDSRGRVLPAGVYLLRLETEGRVLTEKVIMSR